MSKFRIYEIEPGSHDADNGGFVEARKDLSSDQLTRVRIEAVGAYEIAAVHAGAVTVANSIVMHWVYKVHLPKLVEGDTSIMNRYLVPLKSDDPEVERYWLNNRSFLEHQTEEDETLQRIDDARIEIRPSEAN